ncbi:unnamed protein product [Phytomonas sp. EM1]|nr:unnamed protein product [Phytomonas sp. EM1]|eukprot:CCW59550.1 unnamed protein product [Phytomonas sp. isolate EM1]
MPYWENYLCTKPEVDDDDLPLPEHRIFDDYGNLKAQASRQVRPLHERKAHVAVAVKSNAYVLPRFLRALFSNPNTVFVKKSTPNVECASLVPNRKKISPKHSAPRKATSKTGSPTTTSTKKSPERHTGTRARTLADAGTPNQRKSPTKSQGSPGTGTRPSKASTSHGSRGASPVPVATATVVLRSASASRSRSASPNATKKTPARASRSRKSPVSRKRPSRTRSASRRSSSGSPKKRSVPQASGSPSSKWAVVALQEYAKQNEISTRGLRTKSDILSAIRAARS